MSIEKRVSTFFGLNDKTWMRHANPWSVYTRFLIPPLLAAAIFSRIWLEWYALIPVAFVLLWTFVNPVFFRPPASTKYWASKSVFGERIWIERRTTPIPKIHRILPIWLNIFSALSIPFLAYGLWYLDPWVTVSSVAIMVLGKAWFLDRMVWLFEDVKINSKEYQSWEY